MTFLDNVIPALEKCKNMKKKNKNLTKEFLNRLCQSVLNDNTICAIDLEDMEKKIIELLKGFEGKNTREAPILAYHLGLCYLKETDSIGNIKFFRKTSYIKGGKLIKIVDFLYLNIYNEINSYGIDGFTIDNEDIKDHVQVCDCLSKIFPDGKCLIQPGNVVKITLPRGKELSDYIGFDKTI